tara:strand:+ start:56 stop:544 length:489 start_codon:yes stop_codon:yes gene_type:complete
VPDVQTYHVAPYSADGELLGVGTWDIAKLSSKWLVLCRDVISRWGDTFRGALDGNLSHIQLQVTSANGAALVTCTANDEIATSSAFLAGANTKLETDVLAMFHQSLLNAGSASIRDDGFRFADHTERPFAIHVIWGNPAVSDDDYDLIREIGTHLAGAFFYP